MDLLHKRALVNALLVCTDQEAKSERHEEIVWAEDPVTEVRAVMIAHCFPEVQVQIEEAVGLSSRPTLWIGGLFHGDGTAAAYCLNLSMLGLCHTVSLTFYCTLLYVL